MAGALCTPCPPPAYLEGVDLYLGPPPVGGRGQDVDERDVTGRGRDRYWDRDWDRDRDRGRSRERDRDFAGDRDRFRDRDRDRDRDFTGDRDRFRDRGRDFTGDRDRHRYRGWDRTGGPDPAPCEMTQTEGPGTPMTPGTTTTPGPTAAPGPTETLGTTQTQVPAQVPGTTEMLGPTQMMSPSEALSTALFLAQGIAGVIRTLVGRCVQFQLVSGAQITGLVQGIEDGTVRITTGGRTVWLVLDKIDQFRLATGNTC